MWENRGPRHPQPGQNAIVQVEFVIDSAGRADMSTFRPLQPVSANFLGSVREFVSSAKFRPARIGTQPVAMCAKQSFEFGTVYHDRRN
jgi:hypothetical protein